VGRQGDGRHDGHGPAPLAVVATRLLPRRPSSHSADRPICPKCQLWAVSLSGRGLKKLRFGVEQMSGWSTTTTLGTTHDRHADKPVASRDPRVRWYRRPVLRPSILLRSLGPTAGPGRPDSLSRNGPLRGNRPHGPDRR